MAIRRYTGAALPRAHVMTITVANTWATSDTGDVICNGRTLRLTVGATATTAGVAAALAAMINGDAAIGTETRSETGDNVPEFQEVTALASSSTVIITGVTKGVPFTFTVAENTAGSGTLAIAETTAATGPNHYDNANNFSGATLPVDGDTVIFEGDVDVLYGATQSAVTPTAIKFINFTGRFGLPDVNESGGYREYRTKFLAYGASGDATNMAVTVDCDSSRIRLDGGDGQMTINVMGTGSADDGQAFQFKGTHASNAVSVIDGSVGLGMEPDDATTVVLTLKMAGDGGAEVEVGSGVTLGTVDKQNGSLIMHGASSSVTTWDGETTMNGSGAHAVLVVRGGECFYNSTGTLGGNPIVADGVLDFSQDARAKTVTNPIEVFGQTAIVRDPKKVVATLVLDLNNGANSENMDIGQNIRLTRGTPA